MPANNPSPGNPPVPSSTGASTQPAAQFDAAAYAPAKSELQMTGFQYLLSQHQFRGNETVVDLACGDGVGTVQDLKPLVPSGRVFGVDISEGMIAAAKRTDCSDVTFLVGNIERLSEVEGLPQAPGAVDVFVSNYGMHWILGREAMRAFLTQVHERLAPGGTLLSLFAEERIFPGFFECLQDVEGRPGWAPYFNNGTFKHYPLPHIDSFGEDVRGAGFRTEILALRESWIKFSTKEALVNGVLGWLPQYMNRLPAELRKPFAQEVVEHYAAAAPGLPKYPQYTAGEIAVYDMSVVLKATKAAS